MTKPGLGARLRYAFDKSMAKGTVALIGWLGLVSLVIIAIAGLFLAITNIAPAGEEPMGFVEGTWASLMRTLDSGTMGGDAGWGFRLVMLTVTLAGIFVVSALIGVLSSGLESRLDQLRKGRSLVLERDHTIIFNWSPSIFDVIAELVIANESRRRPRIVVMSDKDKVEMEDEIAAKVPDTKNTRIICRSGDPTDLYDIGIVNPATARSIIILSPEEEDADSRVIKTILALVNDPARRAERYLIAAEIREARNAEVARVVGGSEVQLVLADDLLSRIVAQSMRQPGLSAVYTELLDFDGCEIYTTEQPELIGKSFGEALFAYETSTLIGLCGLDGLVSLNPPMETIIEPGMKAIVIAEDDDEIEIRERASAETLASPAEARIAAPRPERTLMLGWNRRGPMIALELSRYVAPGSLLTVAADTPALAADFEGLELAGDNLRVEMKRVDTSRRGEIEALDATSYDHVLVLGYGDDMAAQPADTRTLVTLLHLRRIAEDARRPISVVSEMIDVRNRELAEVARIDDFVVSNKLVSLMLAQASENEHLEAIFRDLLDEEGSEICLRPAGDYVTLGETLSFYEVTRAACARGEVAIGHHIPSQASADDARRMGGIVINPSKAEPLAYTAHDRIIVLARD
jgi:voltage-gated potassium channel Kch